MGNKEVSSIPRTAHTCIDICRTYLSAQIFCLERVSLSVFYKVSFALVKLEML
jgi:hypothetical protein